MTVECTWRGCSSTFVSNSSLRRHVRTVHKHLRSYSCPVADCGGAFSTATGLKRHTIGVHGTERNYKCSRCTKTFAIKHTFLRHEKAVHGVAIKTEDDTVIIEKPTFICAYCENQFNRKDHLVLHIYRTHSNPEYLICHDCGGQFLQKYSLKKHIFAKHMGKNPSASTRHNTHTRCILCQQSFHHINHLLDHYVKFHDVDLNKQTLSFSSVEEFLMWKRNMEDTTVTRFRATRSSKEKKVYTCHRSGYYTVKSADRKRAPLRRGSKKLNGVCPASISLRMDKNGTSCITTFIQTHVGHKANDKDEMKYTFLHREDREKLREFLIAGVPKGQILDEYLNGSDIFCDFINSNVTRSDLLSRKDLWNIQAGSTKKCDESFTKSRHVDSKNAEVDSKNAVVDCKNMEVGSKNIEEFVKEFKNSILLYKRQGAGSPEKFFDCRLKDDDVILIFMCPSQEKILKKRGRNVVCMDGTRDKNSHGLLMHSLLVLDYNGEAFPAAFVFSNRKDKALIKVFLRCIKEKMTEIVTPHTFVSNTLEPYYVAWVEEMSTPEVHLHCMWHVWQVWKKHLPETNKKMKQDLYDLSVEMNIDTFHDKLEKFLTSSVDPTANDFLKFFKKVYCNNNELMRWSYACRLNAGLDTTTHLETFHRTLKYLHGSGKTMTDLYSGLRQILSYVKQKMSWMLGKAVSGKLPPRLTALKQAHKQVLKKGVITIQKIDEGWLVPSFKVTKDGCEEMYLIRKIRDECPATGDEDIRACSLTCSECNECAHKYSCSCIENGIRSNMCKHIHAVILFERAILNQDGESSAGESEQAAAWLIFDENYLPSSAECVQQSPPSIQVQLQTPFSEQKSESDSSTLVLQEITNVLDQKKVDTDQLRQELLEDFTSLINQLETKEECDLMKEYFNHMQAALHASKSSTYD